MALKKTCALNKILSFHILENNALDPMHMILEGIIPFESGCALYELTTVKSFSLFMT